MGDNGWWMAGVLVARWPDLNKYAPFFGIKWQKYYFHTPLLQALGHFQCIR